MKYKFFDIKIHQTCIEFAGINEKPAKMPELDVFDQDEWDRTLGVTGATDVLELPEIQVPESDKQALRQVAAQSPTGITVPTTQTADDQTPDAIKSLIEQKPTLPTVDYAAELEKLTGKPVADGETVTADTLAAEAERLTVYNELLQQHPYYRGFVDFDGRQYGTPEDKAKDDLELIQQNVSALLGNLYTDQLFEGQMAKYVSEGQLTAEGIRKASELRAQIKTQIKAWEDEAKTSASTKADRVLADRKALTESINTLDADDEEKQVLADVFASGDFDSRIKALTPQEKVQIARELYPFLRGKRDLKTYNQGAEQGAKRKVATLLR